MSNIVAPSYETNYISQQKKILVGRNNNTIYQKFKIDTRIQDTYYFQVVSKNNQIVDLSGFSYEFYGSFIDPKQNNHVLFYSDEYTIQDNVLSFKVNTYNSQYINYVKNVRQIDLTIKKKAPGIEQVILRDVGLAYPCPEYQGEDPSEVVAGFGLSKNGYVMSLTGTILSGDGTTIEINDNVISCIGGGGSGTVYTAGEGIGISDQNVISLTATIPVVPTGVSAFDNDAGYLTAIPTTYVQQSDLAEYATTGWVEGKGYISEIPTTYVQQNDLAEYALTSQIPTDYLTSSDLADYAQISAIPTSTSQLTNDSGFITSSALTGISSDNQLKIKNVNINAMNPYSSGFVVGYDKNYDIFSTSNLKTINGELYLTPMSGALTGVNGRRAATFEQWIKPYGNLTGIVVTDGLNWIGQIPSSFTSGYTQVFTRRIIKNSSNSNCIQQVSYAYEFDNSYNYLEPLSFKAVNGDATIEIPNSIHDGLYVCYLDRQDSAWHPLSSNVLSLSSDETVLLSGTRDHLNMHNNYGAFAMTGLVEAGGNIQSLMFWREDVPQYSCCGLFRGCSGLLTAPKLPAITLSNHCYDSMFAGCTSLTAAPQLKGSPYNTEFCYGAMFSGCTSLSTAPQLPATTLGPGCYSFMFKGCTSLTDAPYLPATTVMNGVYSNMFFGCSSLSSINVAMTGWTNSMVGATNDWVNGGVAANGTFTKPTALSAEYGSSRIPVGWQVINSDQTPILPVTFKAVSGATEVTLVKGGNPYSATLDYSVNDGAWTSYTFGDTINLALGDTVAFSGNNDHFNVDGDNKYLFTFNNRVEGYGNVQSLLGFDKTTFDDHVFDSLFEYCTNLQTAPNVFISGTAGSNCMSRMFYGCENLKKGPIIGDVYLSGEYSMQRMFRDCTSLTAVQLKFNSWGADENNSYAWIMDADNPTSYSSAGIIIIPQGFSYSRGGYTGMPESSAWIILNRIDGQLYYAENEDGHSQGDLFTGTDPFAS